jgi:hypothetical protein
MQELSNNHLTDTTFPVGRIARHRRLAPTVRDYRERINKAFTINLREDCRRLNARACLTEERAALSNDDDSGLA